MIVSRCLLVLLGICVATAVAWSEETPPSPGHSYHGESFSQGPRQQARLMGGTGRVALAITAKTPEVQQFFDQGLGQVHGFWYYEAERSFRQAAALDPGCAMAYWGMALANINNETRAKSFIAEALKRKEQASAREQKYIQSLHDFYHADAKKTKKERTEKYLRDLEKLMYDFPDELEAKSLLVHGLWHARDAGVPITSFFALDALLGQIFAVEPRHPSHHYRIHLWDKERSQLALTSAAQCGQSAPGIAHMWHMSGHIYSDTERYVDAVWQQSAAVRVDHAYMMRDQILPDQIHNFAHNTEWLIRNCDHLGQFDLGYALARNMIAMPRHPQFNHLEKRSSTSAFGKQRLMELFERYERWGDLARLTKSPTLDEPKDRHSRIEQARWQTLAALHQKQFDQATPWLAILDREQRVLKGQADAIRDELDPEAAPLSALLASTDDGPPVSALSPRNALDKRRDGHKQLETELQKLVKIQHELRGVRAFAEGRFTEAHRELKQADVSLMDQNFLTRVQFAAGDRDAALKKLKSAVSGRKNQVRPLAHLVDLLWQAGQKDEARERFESLRTIAGGADLSVPLLARLQPIARELGWPDDWRTPATPATDVGERPSLDTLGPMLWSPPSAPDWTAFDVNGGVRMSQEFTGRPMVFLFYLGAGCLHCTEQLQKFAAQARDWERLGVGVVGISTDDTVKLAAAIKNYQPAEFPFLLVSDSSMQSFRAWRCFDDFEKQPLHGTFLVDASGRLRWWDISHEPFSNVVFLLKETERLLSSDRP